MLGGQEETGTKGVSSGNAHAPVYEWNLLFDIRGSQVAGIRGKMEEQFTVNRPADSWPT